MPIRQVRCGGAAQPPETGAGGRGRLQVTNKRLLFRATGRSVRGKTTLQHEFALDDMKGFEIHKNYRFSILDLLVGADLCGGGWSPLWGAMVTGLFRSGAAGGRHLRPVVGGGQCGALLPALSPLFLKLCCAAPRAPCRCSGVCDVPDGGPVRRGGWISGWACPPSCWCVPLWC